MIKPKEFRHQGRRKSLDMARNWRSFDRCANGETVCGLSVKFGLATELLRGRPTPVTAPLPALQCALTDSPMGCSNHRPPIFWRDSWQPPLARIRGTPRGGSDSSDRPLGADQWLRASHHHLGELRPSCGSGPSAGFVGVLGSLVRLRTRSVPFGGTPFVERRQPPGLRSGVVWAVASPPCKDCRSCLQDWLSS